MASIKSSIYKYWLMIAWERFGSPTNHILSIYFCSHSTHKERAIILCYILGRINLLLLKAVSQTFKVGEHSTWQTEFTGCYCSERGRDVETDSKHRQKLKIWTREIENRKWTKYQTQRIAENEVDIIVEISRTEHNFRKRTDEHWNACKLNEADEEN